MTFSDGDHFSYFRDFLQKKLPRESFRPRRLEKQSLLWLHLAPN
ncbi:hypothetical protein GCK32_022585 [Trichostrongylus colubriformis]